MEKILVALRVYPGNTKIPTIIYPDKKIELINDHLMISIKLFDIIYDGHMVFKIILNTFMKVIRLFVEPRKLRQI